jgi:hypothetical protein
MQTKKNTRTAKAKGASKAQPAARTTNSIVNVPQEPERLLFHIKPRRVPPKFSKSPHPMQQKKVQHLLRHACNKLSRSQKKQYHEKLVKWLWEELKADIPVTQLTIIRQVKQWEKEDKLAPKQLHLPHT